MSSLSGTVVCDEIFDETSHPSEDEVLEYASKIGIDPDNEAHLLPLAYDGLMRALPNGWKPCYENSLGRWYYFNFDTNETRWEHPLDEVYKEKVRRARAEGYDGSVGDEDSKTSAKEDLKSFEETLNSSEAMMLSSRSLESLQHQSRLSKLSSPAHMTNKGGAKRRSNSPETVRQVERFPATAVLGPSSTTRPPQSQAGHLSLRSASPTPTHIDINALTVGPQPSPTTEAVSNFKVASRPPRSVPSHPAIVLTGGGSMFLKSRAKEQGSSHTPIEQPFSNKKILIKVLPKENSGLKPLVTSTVKNVSWMKGPETSNTSGQEDRSETANLESLRLKGILRETSEPIVDVNRATNLWQSGPSQLTANEKVQLRNEELDAETKRSVRFADLDNKPLDIRFQLSDSEENSSSIGEEDKENSQKDYGEETETEEDGKIEDINDAGDVCDIQDFNIQLKPKGKPNNELEFCGPRRQGQSMLRTKRTHIETFDTKLNTLDSNTSVNLLNQGKENLVNRISFLKNNSLEEYSNEFVGNDDNEKSMKRMIHSERDKKTNRDGDNNSGQKQELKDSFACRKLFDLIIPSDSKKLISSDNGDLNKSVSYKQGKKSDPHDYLHHDFTSSEKSLKKLINPLALNEPGGTHIKSKRTIQQGAELFSPFESAVSVLKTMSSEDSVTDSDADGKQSPLRQSSFDNRTSGKKSDVNESNKDIALSGFGSTKSTISVENAEKMWSNIKDAGILLDAMKNADVQSVAVEGNGEVGSPLIKQSRFQPKEIQIIPINMEGKNCMDSKTIALEERLENELQKRNAELTYEQERKIIAMQETSARKLTEEEARLQQVASQFINELKCKFEKRKIEEETNLRDNCVKYLHDVEAQLQTDQEAQIAALTEKHEAVLKEDEERWAKEKEQKGLEMRRTIEEMDALLAEKIEEINLKEENVIEKLKVENSKKIELMEQDAKTKERELIERNEEELKRLNRDWAESRKRLTEEERIAHEELETARQRWQDRLAALEQEQAGRLEHIRLEHEAAVIQLRAYHRQEEDEIKEKHSERMESWGTQINGTLEKKSLDIVRLNRCGENMPASQSAQLVSFKPREYEKVRCEKRLLEEKYRSVKSKYLQLKSEVRLSLERKKQSRKERGGGGGGGVVGGTTLATTDDTDRSTSRSKTQSGSHGRNNSPQRRCPATINNAVNGNPTKMTIRKPPLPPSKALLASPTNPSSSSALRETGCESELSQQIEKPKNSRYPSPPPLTSFTLTRREGQQLQDSEEDIDEDVTSSADDCMPKQTARAHRTLKVKHTVARRGRLLKRLTTSTGNSVHCKPVTGEGGGDMVAVLIKGGGEPLEENLRRQCQKLDDLEEQFPPSTHPDTFTLRYPFTEHQPSPGENCKLEFFRHRLHVEQESVRRAKESLVEQTRLLQSRQLMLINRAVVDTNDSLSTMEKLHQEERDLTNMELSLHRTRALLSEKMIRLHHLEASLGTVERESPPRNSLGCAERESSPPCNSLGHGDHHSPTNTLSEPLLSHQLSHGSGFSSSDLEVPPTHQPALLPPAVDESNRTRFYCWNDESANVVQRLENINCEIREIWSVLGKQQIPGLGPPPLLYYGEFNNALQGTYPPPATLQNTFRRAPVPNNNSGEIAQRTRGLRDWLYNNST